MRYRTNPWPAFADLFSAVLIVTFAGLVMITAAYRSDMKSQANRNDPASPTIVDGGRGLVTARVIQARLDANRIIEQVKKVLDSDTEVKSRTRECGDDTCVDLDIEFERNQAIIKDPAALNLLSAVARQLKSAIDELPAEQRRDIEIVIEGRADKTQASGAALDERGRYLFNWDLSSRRATSVAYEFKKMNLTPDRYRVVAIGYAEWDPICQEGAPGCDDDTNRRTTLILRGNTRGIAQRLARQAGGAAGVAPR
ncbi:MAG TPA: OmpA family protein [Pyrinomonadaceae bacterium]|nr:OmpA family protein [Pyrinomonadaceae bacterium]